MILLFIETQKKIIIKIIMPISNFISYGLNIFDITSDYIRRASLNNNNSRYHL